jgi:methylglutaconyl-CoA hydratase
MEDKEREKMILDLARRSALSESVRLAAEICEGGPVAVRAAIRAVEEPRETVENNM